jgi:hypothetical protein
MCATFLMELLELDSLGHGPINWGNVIPDGRANPIP